MSKNKFGKESWGLVADGLSISRAVAWLGLPSYFARPEVQAAIKSVVENEIYEYQELVIFLAPIALTLFLHLVTDVLDGAIAKGLAGRIDEQGYGSTLDSLADFSSLPGMLSMLTIPQNENFQALLEQLVQRNVGVSEAQTVITSLCLSLMLLLLISELRTTNGS